MTNYKLLCNAVLETAEAIDPVEFPKKINNISNFGISKLCVYCIILTLHEYILRLFRNISVSTLHFISIIKCINHNVAIKNLCDIGQTQCAHNDVCFNPCNWKMIFLFALCEGMSNVEPTWLAVVIIINDSPQTV